MESATPVQILDETVCISLCANALGKSMNQSVLFPALSKLSGRLSSLALIRQAIKKENSEFKPDVLRLNIDIVFHHAHDGEVRLVHTQKSSFLNI